MKGTTIFIIILLCIFTACSNRQDKEQEVLLKGLTIPKDNKPKWSELFSDKYSITQLETTPECLIGVIHKIKKFKGHYYISSGGRSIFHFNEQGKFISVLDNKGNGPEEYSYIEDFDVYEIDGRTEIWVSDYQNLKIYDANDCSFIYKISYPFAIYKFKRMDNSHVLFVTGQNEHSLTLTDKNGNILSEYLEKKIPYLVFRPVQFVKYDSKYLFQLGISNAFISFDPKTETFSKGYFTKETSYLSDKQMLELFEIHGTDFIGEANKGSFISNIVSLNDTIWVELRYAGKNYIAKIQNGQITSTEFTVGSFAPTMTIGDSDSSLLLYLRSDLLLESGEKITDKDGNEIKCEIDDNPIVIEFF
ncbi:6-bladed beta-propeller [Parabacteroides goldsteinii]|uniref:6-bladed beta-propeller n=1 Tax=Parabacteroides goldsteinii TaxID=328812 RepID=UPI001CCFE4CA|nr:6-bladed beta-propeller [Parabacteroides goldsteinii]UBD77459.1 6-bladed beta-propeller [Parabacteroides goldsteinii]